MRLKLFRIFNLAANIVSLAVSIIVFVFSIIHDEDPFHMAAIACGLAVVFSIFLLAVSIKNIHKDTCMLVDLAFNKDFSTNKVAFYGAIVLLVLSVLMVIGGILLITLVKQYLIAYPLMELGNIIFFNIISFFVYMYVELHY